MNAPSSRPRGQAGATKQLAHFAAELRYEHLAEAEKAAVRRHALDTIGACIAGSQGNVSQLAAGILESLLAPGACCVPGLARRFDILSAAYLTGASCHGIELDDGYRAGSLHPGTVVVPALIAAAQNGEHDGRQFMTAMAVGYEAQCRIGEAIHPRTRQRGFHNTSIAGVFAAALAVGKLRGLDERTLEQALGIAASSSAGLFAFLHGGGEVKRLHPGFAAREGLFAALLAERGMTGPIDVLESKDGFFAAYSSEGCTLRLPREPGQTGAPLAITECYLKPHACCRHLHSAVDAILALRKELDLAPGDVRQVDVGTYAIAAEHAHAGWQDMASAQMSFPYVGALALTRGHVDLDDFSEASRADPAVIGRIAQIRVAVDPECERIYPGVRSARVAIATRDGRRHERMVREPLGSPQNPMSEAAVTAKFCNLAARVFPQAKAQALQAEILRLESIPLMHRLLSQLAGG